MPNTSLLVILDGFGHSEIIENNAIAAADTKNWQRLMASHPNTLISGSGLDVGLPQGQMGNSEVGHMNLGAGRVVYQDLTRINRAIEQGEFATNTAFNDLFDKVKGHSSALHLMGLLSPGGVHSLEDHIHEMLKLAANRGVTKIYVHAFLDGRDTPPRSATASLQATNTLCEALSQQHSIDARIVSLCGRFYAMDRDQRWDRVQQAYNLIVRGEAPFHATDASSGLQQAYARDENDEFVQPTAIHAFEDTPICMNDGDGVIFMNYRSDRAREITRSIITQDFADFDRRSTVDLCDFVTLTQYADDIHTSCAFQPTTLHNTLGEYIQSLNKTQLRIAETEKYAHVTFFFSGGREQPFEGEDRILIPSPKVATYDLQPEMSAAEVTDELVNAINSNSFDLIICNYANGDMVGHTGDFQAAVKAVNMLDVCVGRLAEAVNANNGQMLITADHGNVEQMQDPSTGQAHTAHTSEPVPLLYVGEQEFCFAAAGTLSDVAPTLLELMDLPKPAEMTGQSLVRKRITQQRHSA